MKNRFWTKEKCIEEAKKYNNKKDFYTNSISSYRSSLKNNWLDEICSHMIELRKPKGYWTKEKCQEESLKYKTRTEFQKNSSRAYHICKKNGWL